MVETNSESKSTPTTRKRRTRKKRKTSGPANPDEATTPSPEDNGQGATATVAEARAVDVQELPSDGGVIAAEGVRTDRRKRSRRSRRKRGAGRAADPGATAPANIAGQTAETDRAEAPVEEKAPPEAPAQAPSGGRKRRRGRRKRGGGNGSASDTQSQKPATQTTAETAHSEETPSRSSRHRRRGRTIKMTASIAKPPADDSRMMVINAADSEECRIAVIQQNRLEELFIERASAESHVGNIYKGRVTNVEPSIQAAFVDFGLPKNGFLHISDLQPQYFPDRGNQPEKVGRKTPRRERPPIQKCLRRGQEVLVQIIKEGIGTKGPTLSTYISIPGRYLVMMPGMNKLGVSRKIEDEDARRKMRKILEELDLPRDKGFILRTAGLDKTKRDLQRDYMYLQRLWKQVAQRIKNDRAPCELYRESDLVTRTIRDVYSTDFSKIVVDDEATAQKVRDFLDIAMPRSGADIEVYTGNEPIFHKYDIEAEMERINDRHVPLPSGGSLVIDTSEAMVTIDVNSGRFRDHSDAEQTAFRTDLEAAEEIARQLRLRDLGGLILCDFIDLREEKHRRGVERALRDALKKHKERAKCLRMSQFGIIEITRQRMRPSIKRSIYRDCPHCHGSGLIKNAESMTLDIMRLLNLAAHHEQVVTVEIRVSPDVEHQLQNRKRKTIHDLETKTGRRVIIRADGNIGLDKYAFECLDQRGGVVQVLDLPDRYPPRGPHHARSGGRAHDQQRSHGHDRDRDPSHDQPRDPEQPVTVFE